MSNLKIIYKPSGKAGEYAKLAANLMIGKCAHGCVYCYAPQVLTNKESLVGDPRPKHLALSRLEHDARILEREGITEPVFLSFTTDPYQPIEEKEKITRSAIEILLAHNLGVNILTKGGSRSARDFELLASNKDCKYGTTLVFSEDELSRKYEPGAAPTSERIAALKIAHEMGIKTWVSLEPVYFPPQTYQLINMTHEFVDEYKVGKLNYKPEADNVNWRDFAEQVVKILKFYNKTYYIKHDLRVYLKAKERYSDIEA